MENLQENQKIKDFIEDEAELSGNEMEHGGDDEGSENDEEMQKFCVQDTDLPSQEIIRDKIAGLHLKQMLNDDEEILQQFQEICIEENDSSTHKRNFACESPENVDYKDGSSSDTDEENDAVHSWCAKWIQENETKSSPMKTSHLYQQDDNAASSSTFHSRYKLAMELSQERNLRQDSSKVQSVPQKVPRCLSVLADYGINYDDPLDPMTIDSKQQERMKQEKLNSQPTAVAMHKRKVEEESSKVQSVAVKVRRRMCILEACGSNYDELLNSMTVDSNQQERSKREKLNCQPTPVAMQEFKKRKVEEESSKLQSVAEKVRRRMCILEAGSSNYDELLNSMTVDSNQQERSKQDKLNCQPTAVLPSLKEPVKSIFSRYGSN